MGTVNVTLEREAESIFTDLGYTVTGDGSEIRAERKWRVVQVTPMPEPEAPPASGEMRCFVTYEDRLAQVERTLLREDPDYEWAIIGVGEDSDYVVSR
jgi:hypothetical protein